MQRKVAYIEGLTGADVGGGGGSPSVELTALLGPCCSSAAQFACTAIGYAAEGEVVEIMGAVLLVNAAANICTGRCYTNCGVF